MNLILVRLACCCGLRVNEIASLRLSDLRRDLTGPHIRIRRGAAKGAYPRMVPLWWDHAVGISFLFG
jgi:integrase